MRAGVTRGSAARSATALARADVVVGDDEVLEEVAPDGRRARTPADATGADHEDSHGRQRIRARARAELRAAAPGAYDADRDRCACASSGPDRVASSLG